MSRFIKNNLGLEEFAKLRARVVEEVKMLAEQWFNWRWMLKGAPIVGIDIRFKRERELQRMTAFGWYIATAAATTTQGNSSTEPATYTDADILAEIPLHGITVRSLLQRIRPHMITIGDKRGALTDSQKADFETCAKEITVEGPNGLLQPNPKLTSAAPIRRLVEDAERKAKRQKREIKEIDDALKEGTGPTRTSYAASDAVHRSLQAYHNS